MLPNKAMKTTPVIINNVASLETEKLFFHFGSKSCVNAAEHVSIWESAVEIVAENKPAKIPPTKMEGKSWVAKIGSANSVSDEASSGSKTRAVNPTPRDANEKMRYHRK